MALDFETTRMLWCVDVISSKKELKAPAEITECFVRATNLLKVYNLPKDRIPPASRYILDYASNHLLNPVRETLDKRGALLEEMLKWDAGTLKALPRSVQHDLTELAIFDFEPELRSKVLTLVEKVARDGSIRFFKLATASSLPMVWLLQDNGHLLVTAEPFMVDKATLKEFDGHETDTGEFFSRMFMLALYAKKNNLFSKEELSRDNFAMKNLREAAKLFLKCAKESDFSMKVSSLLKEGDFWEAAMLLNGNENIYKTMRHAGMCTLVNFADGGVVWLTTFSTDCVLRFDARSLESIAKTKAKEKEASLGVVSSVYSLFYSLQQFFTGYYDVTKEFDPETASGLVPQQILADCIFGHTHYEGNLREFVGLKNMVINFKGGKVLEIGKSEEDFTIGDPMLHTVYFVMTTMQGAALRADFYFMPAVWHLMAEMKAAGDVNEAVVARANKRFNYFGKLWNYVQTPKERKIVGHFTDAVAIARKVKK